MTTQFQIGKTYATRSACDHNTVFAFTILDRTASTITTEIHGERKTRRVKEWNGIETFKPFGSYSMCPVLFADRECA